MDIQWFDDNTYSGMKQNQCFQGLQVVRILRIHCAIGRFQKLKACYVVCTQKAKKFVELCNKNQYFVNASTDMTSIRSAYGIKIFSNHYGILLFKVLKSCNGCVLTIKGYEHHIRSERSLKKILLPQLYIDFQFWSLFWLLPKQIWQNITILQFF